MRWGGILRWGVAALDMLLPGDYVCAGCGITLSQADDALCPRCIHEVQGVGGDLCPLCGFYLPAPGEDCPYCGGSPLRVADRFYCAGYLTGRLQTMVYRLKYNGEKDASRGLGQLLAQKIDTAGDLPGGVVLLPVPLHPRREKERGYNQATLIAQEMSLRLQLSVDTTILSRIVDTPHQVGAPAGERRQNMQGAFAATPQAQNGHFLIIDDVATTGATLEACVVALRQAGAAWVGIAAATRTPRSSMGTLLVDEK